MKLQTKTILALLTVLTSLVTTAAPAAATIYPVSAPLTNGLVRLTTYFGSFPHYVPRDQPCGETTTTMEFDDEGDGDADDSVRDFTMSIKEPGVFAMSGYRFEVTGSAAGPFPWDSTTGEFGPVSVPMTVLAREIDFYQDCTEGEVQCESTLTMEFTGVTVSPPPGSHGALWITGATTTPTPIYDESCPPLFQLLFWNATVDLGGYGGSPAAYFLY